MFASADSRSLSKLARLAAACIMMTCVAGCATRQGVLLPDISSWEARTRILGGHEDWEFNARIAVSAGDDGFNGKLRWTQEDEAFFATVSGPLGIGTVRIEGDGESVVLTDKDGVRTELDDVEIDLQYRYGWTIPVTSLRYWALGIPDPSVEASTEFNEAGQLAELTQRDWDVSISRYREGGGQLMPSRVTASNADTRVRIVIDRWLFF